MLFRFRMYDGSTIDLLDMPGNGKPIGKISGEVYGVRIDDICGNWVKISIKGVSGWISSDHLCGVPWTTCN